MHKVAILTYNNMSMFELGCAIELFALPRPEYSNWYQTEVVSFEAQAVTATAGIQLQSKVINSLSDYQTLIIPGWSTNKPEVPALLKHEILQLHQRQGRLLSFCSGSFLLAELGLLDQHPATTHWRYADNFRQRYPRVNFIDNVLYLYDGTIGCSAGSAAALDLGLEVIRQDFGYKIANQVARRLVISPHRSGGQSQYVETPMVKHHDHFSATLDWVLKNLDQPLNINLLASQTNMSRRSFDRHFRAALNLSPKQWINQQRLDMARQLLEHSQYSIDRVAEKSGFDSAINLRHHFRRSFGLSPGRYRSQLFQRNECINIPAQN